MQYDVLLRGGLVVDGSGEPAYNADVALKDGRIATIAPNLKSSDAVRVIEADGMVICPGFVDAHTHYDAQVCFDEMLTPSCYFGITSVVIGNCGFTIAPCKPQDRAYLTNTLSKVEGMPQRALEAGIDWSFESFPQYLDMIEQKHRPALNIAALAGHSALRLYAMGAEAGKRPANEIERQQIKQLFYEAMQAGAFGLGTSTLPVHLDGNGQPVPSRLAAPEEFDDLIEVFKELGRGTFEITPGGGAIDWMAGLSQRSGRPVTWAPLMAFPANPDLHRHVLKKVAGLQAQGIQLYPQTGCFPLTMDLSLEAPYVFENLPVWQRIFKAPRREWTNIMRDDEFRATFRQELAERPLLFHGKWQHTDVQPTLPEHEAWRGKSIAQIAQERGTDPLDTFFDLGLEEDLKTRFILALLNIDEELVLELISHPSVLIAASDAGAHLTLLCDAGYPARLLGYWVRDKGALQLEAAVKSLTSTPARIYGIKERGMLRPGYFADVVVYDPTTIIDNPKRLVHDLPGGEPRLTRDATGINYVFVNGQPLISEGKIAPQALEKPSGQLLRAGR